MGKAIKKYLDLENEIVGGTQTPQLKGIDKEKGMNCFDPYLSDFDEWVCFIADTIKAVMANKKTYKKDSH